MPPPLQGNDEQKEIAEVKQDAKKEKQVEEFVEAKQKVRGLEAGGGVKGALMGRWEATQKARAARGGSTRGAASCAKGRLFK